MTRRLVLAADHSLNLSTRHDHRHSFQRTGHRPRQEVRHRQLHALPGLPGPRREARTSGTPRATATSTSSPAGAAASSATARRASSRRCRSRSPQLIHVPNTWYTEPQGLLGQALGERTDFGGKCFFCNSGTEANEAAIKLARLNGKPGPVQDRHHDQQLPRPHDGRAHRHRPAEVPRGRRADAARLQLRPVRRPRRRREG